MENDNTQSWHESLPEPLRNAPFLGKAENVDDAVAKLAHAAQLVGTSIRIPGENASDDDRAAFYQKLSEVPGVARLPVPDDIEGLNSLLAKLGKPEEPSKYVTPEVENFEWDTDMLTDLRRYAHEAGMTNTQFQKFAQQIAQQELEAASAAQSEQEAERAALKADWGEALTEREDLIRGWLKQSQAPESMMDMLDNKSLPNSTMKWLYDIASQFKDTTNPVSKDRDSRGAPTVAPAEAKAKIAEILANPAYFDAADPRHPYLKQEMLKYQALAISGEAA